jgi:hypothetical protein
MIEYLQSKHYRSIVHNVLQLSDEALGYVRSLYLLIAVIGSILFTQLTINI